MVQGSDGKIYGTTSAFGQFNDGTVFSISPTGTMVTTLHTFGSSSSDGVNPQAGLVEGASGTFYGTTQGGGTAGFGTIFKITTTPSITFSILHSFADGSVTNDGRVPQAGLTLGADGIFYGTTSAGGSAGIGSVFSVTSGGMVTILHSFTGGLHDGSDPRAGLVQGADHDYTLYGTTTGGGTIGGGIIFSITPQGSMNVLHNFGDPAFPNDGKDPLAAVTFGPDGNLYGTTNIGSTFNAGTVFKCVLTPSTDSPTMPVWALIALALFLCLGAIRFLPKRNLL